MINITIVGFITLCVVFFWIDDGIDQISDNKMGKGNQRHISPKAHGENAKLEANGLSVDRLKTEILSVHTLDADVAKKGATTDRPLDLTLPNVVVEDRFEKNGNMTDIASDEELSLGNRLPDLFKKAGKKEGVHYAGGVFRDKENEDYLDSIEGAEISVEFTLD